MSLVPESLYELFEFERTGSVKKTLNIGIANQIERFINDKTPYQMEDGKYGYRKKSPLWVCTKYNKPHFVKFLLQTGASPVAHESAALRWACGYGLTEIVAMLLDAGADPDAEGPGPGAETYRWAAREGHTDVIDLLNRSKRGEKFFPPEDEPTTVAQKVSRTIHQPQAQVEEPEPEEENKGWI